MTDNELEQIRKRKLEELQKQKEAEAQHQQQVSQAQDQIKSAMRQILDTEAWDQWNNAVFANSDLNGPAYAAAQVLLQAVQSGQIKGKVSKEQLRTIMSKVNQAGRKEFKIRRI